MALSLGLTLNCEIIKKLRHFKKTPATTYCSRMALEWATAVWSEGIDFDLPGNGGPACLATSSLDHRVYETLITFVPFAIALWAGRTGKPQNRYNEQSQWPAASASVRLPLLYSMLVTWAAEVGYKLVTRQLIFVVNPCHLLCLVQAYLLSDCQLLSGVVSKNTVFRLHLFFLHGPLMACIFPVTNTLFLPGEVLTYWVEHALLLIIPFYLLASQHTLYTVPATLREVFSWTALSYGVWGIYHYFILQPLALVSLANLNSILCPAITDPFRGPAYRLHALWHQALATIVSGSFWCTFGKKMS